MMNNAKEQKLSGSPKFIIQFDGVITPNLIDKFQEVWNLSVKTGLPVFLGEEFKIFMMNEEGELALMDNSQVIGG